MDLSVHFGGCQCTMHAPSPIEAHSSLDTIAYLVCHPACVCVGFPTTFMGAKSSDAIQNGSREDSQEDRNREVRYQTDRQTDRQTDMYYI